MKTYSKLTIETTHLAIDGQSIGMKTGPFVPIIYDVKGAVVQWLLLFRDRGFVCHDVESESFHNHLFETVGESMQFVHKGTKGDRLFVELLGDVPFDANGASIQDEIMAFLPGVGTVGESGKTTFRK